MGLASRPPMGPLARASCRPWRPVGSASCLRWAESPVCKAEWPFGKGPVAPAKILVAPWERASRSLVACGGEWEKIGSKKPDIAPFTQNYIKLHR